MKIFAVLLVVVLAGSSAFAQPSLTEPLPDPPKASEVELKDPVTATTLSLVGTLAPLGLALAATALDMDHDTAMVIGWGAALGTIVGPSLGHWYSGNFMTGGLAMRGIGGAVFIAGAVSAFDQCFLVENCNSSGADAAMVAGALLYAGGMIYDVATAGAAAREYNDKHRSHRTVQLVPAVVGRDAAPGLGLVGTF